MLLVIFDSQEWGNLNLDIFVGNIKEVFIELQDSWRYLLVMNDALEVTYARLQIMSIECKVKFQCVGHDNEVAYDFYSLLLILIAFAFLTFGFEMRGSFSAER